MLSFLGARFPNPDLEARYRDLLASDLHLREDARFGAIRILTLIALAIRSLSLNGLGGPTLGAVVAMLGPLGQVLIQRWAARRGLSQAMLRVYMRARTAMIVLWRLVLVPVAAKYWFSGWFPGPGEGASVGTLGAFYAMGSGIAILAIVSLAGNLVLEEHLAVQAAAVALMMRMRGSDFCDVVAGNDAMSAHAVGAWRVLEAISRSILGAMYWGEVATTGPPDPKTACLVELGAAYFAVGVVGITYVLWLREARSRRLFIAGVAHRGAPGWMGGFWWRPLSARRLAGHGAVAAILFAVAWRMASRSFGDLRGSGLGTG
eukprot:evm.model.scf_676.4 EVM.evm.TU.scf_676.4   scf_676:66104-67054(-)